MTTSGSVVFLGIPYVATPQPLETWTWSPTGWTQELTNGTPRGRFHAAVAAREAQIVLFGGDPLTDTFLSDTWTLDGTTWTEQHPAITPPARSRAAVAAIGDKVLVFGGVGHLAVGSGTEEGSLADTWLWDGVNWTQVDTPVAPSARTGAAAAAVGGKVVLFGGCVGGDYYACNLQGTNASDTWQWDETTGWTQLWPATSPGARNSAAIASFGSKALLFGGFAGSGDDVTLGDAWIWDGATWTEEMESVPGRAEAALACE